jgi:uncharacterized protein (DUF58 family)
MKFKYLRPEDIRNLQRFVFAPRTVVEGHLAGRHRSLTVGSSTEFRDYRPYVPGDDLRKVDWRVFARTDRHYLRTHNQETNTVCHVFLDSSASMGFGSPASKLDYASFFASALSYLVLRNGDAVSLQLFDQDVRRFFAPGSTTAHLYNLLHGLEDNRPGGPTALSSALRRAFPLLRRKGALVVLSDFFDDPVAIFSALSPYLHRGFEVHLFHVLDPMDLDLPERGLVTFGDLETSRRVIAHTRSIRAEYRDAMRGHIGNLRELSRRRRVHYQVARTDQPYFALFDELVQ